MVFNRVAWSSSAGLMPFAYDGVRSGNGFVSYMGTAAEMDAIQDQVREIPDASNMFYEAAAIEQTSAQAAIIKGSWSGPFFPDSRLSDVRAIGERLPDNMREIERLPGNDSFANAYNNYASNVQDAANTLYIDNPIMTASDTGIIGAENFGVGQSLFDQSYEALATGAGLQFAFTAFFAYQAFRTSRVLFDKDFSAGSKAMAVGGLALLGTSILAAPALPLMLAAGGADPIMLQRASFGAVAMKAGAAIACHKMISHGKKGYDQKLKAEFVRYEA